MDQVSQACDNYDLAISTKNRGCTPTSTWKTYHEPTITVNGQKLKVVDKFAYLGSTLSKAVHIDDEVTARIAKASMAFGRLRANVWERNRIKLDIKLKVYAQGCGIARPGQYTNVMLRDLTISSCLRKLLKSSGKTRFQTQRS